MMQVNRHHDSKSSVKKRMTRSKNGMATHGQKPPLPCSVEQATATYVDDHTKVGMTQYQDEVWERAEQLAWEAKVKFTASWSWWCHLGRQWPTIVPHMKEAIKLERVRAEDPTYVKEWFDGYQQTLSGKGIKEADQIVIIDEAGTSIGYGNGRKVSTKREECQSW